MVSVFNVVNLIMLLGIVTILESSRYRYINEGKESGFVKICDSIIFPSLPPTCSSFKFINLPSPLMRYPGDKGHSLILILLKDKFSNNGTF